MNIISTPGCCVAYNIYNLGNAHGFIPHSNLYSFATAIKKVVGSNPRYEYYAWSNRGQEIERGYLASMGFDTRRVGSLYLSSITGADLAKFFADDKVFEEERKKEQERQEAAARKQAEDREKARVDAEARRIARENHINKDGSKARKRGELRVGDHIHRYRWTTTGTWISDGIVSAVNEDGTVTIRGPRGGVNSIRPIFNNGSGRHNIERIPPKVNRYRWHY